VPSNVGRSRVLPIEPNMRCAFHLWIAVVERFPDGLVGVLGPQVIYQVDVRPLLEMIIV